MAETNSTLCVHRGAKIVTREELKALPAPVGTESWKPIPHHQLVEVLDGEFKRRNIEVKRSQFAVQKAEASLLFGVYDLQITSKSGEFGAAYGFRTSNDKSLALRGVVGSRVFVCDNLALSGDEIVLNRRHTSGLKIEVEVMDSVTRFFEKYNMLEDHVNKMKDYKLMDWMAKEMIYDAMIVHRVMPLRLIENVHQEYFEPSYPEFKEVGENLWRLNNAFTTTAKQLNVNSQLGHLKEVGKYFSNLIGVKTEGE